MTEYDIKTDSYVVNMGYEAGFRGIRQLIRTWHKMGLNQAIIDYNIERYTYNLLNRCAPDWMRS